MRQAHRNAAYTTKAETQVVGFRKCRALLGHDRGAHPTGSVIDVGGGASRLWNAASGGSGTYRLDISEAALDRAKSARWATRRRLCVGFAPISRNGSLDPAQIEKDIEGMALFLLKQHPSIDQPDFAKACGDVPSAVIAEMNLVQKRDLAAKRREFGPAAPGQR